MATDDVTQALRQCLAECTPPVSTGARDGLRHAVSVYVAEKKMLGWPPERVIIGLKSIAYDAGFPTTLLTPIHVHLFGDKQKVVSDMVSWCVEEFYASADG